jgi:hypothetical protein
MVHTNEASSGASPSLSGSPRAAISPRDGGVFWVRAALLAVVASLMAWPALLVIDGKFPVENLSVEMTNLIRNNRNDPVAWAQERMNRWTSLAKTASICLAAFGGVFVGLASARDEATRRWSLRKFLAGVGFGAGAGILGGLAEATLVVRLERLFSDRLLLSAMGHAVGWAFLATALVLMLGMSRPSPARWLTRLLEGVGGAVVASLVYAVVAAVAFPMLRSDLPIPEGALNKLVFLLVASGVMGSVCLRPGRHALAESASVASMEVLLTQNIATS